MQQRFREKLSQLGRRPPSREPKHRLLVVCEGKKTEPLYFKALQHHFRNSLVHVEINDDSGVPMTVVNRAIKLREDAVQDARGQRDDNLKFDEVWCVVDVDEHPNLTEACALAKTAGVEVALSNPCFELWPLLHFKDQSTAIDRHAAQSELRGFMPGYRKEIDFSKLIPGYKDAVSRAESLDKIATAVAVTGRNPSTTVHVLAERIRLAGAT